ncbi:hypothetical protein Salat_0141600 [Sesamum alatum]|uniref:Uncharacterized protein n=1 Tax=Sesamum alatum TaxID=300844 RepID=A0AAE1YWH4_9LAMI|nr:hypothetical protein Salat_0141600 [Sesamum alatum]
MESDILNLDSALFLTEEEYTDVVIPQSDWDKGVEGYSLTLVGRLMSHRAVHFEALKGMLVQLIQAVGGVTVRKISETRFYLDDPLLVSLDWSPFFVHIHDLRFGQRSVDVIRYIGFVDPGVNCPFGSWLRATGPMRRLGGISDSICPTYVWNSPRPVGNSGDQRRGAQIFGTFRLAQGGSPSSSSSVPPVSIQFPMRLG